MARYGKVEYEGDFSPGSVHEPSDRTAEAGDERASPVYVYDDDIVLAINVAIATGRPLLVRGESGSGKSSLARNAADALGWRYYERVITSRTKAQDLLWEVDLLRRLHDAQQPGAELGEDFTPYVVPGPLWWAFEPESAHRRGARTGAKIKTIDDPAAAVKHPRAVVLLDEIDKADPDVPNNLLVPLGSLQFKVEETGVTVKTKAQQAPLVIITTNDERELPAAFLRRCVEIELKLPAKRRLVDIGHAHFPDLGRAYLGKVAETLAGPDVKDGPDESLGVSPAEFLDTLRAAAGLRIKRGSKLWDRLAEVTFWKHGRKRPGTKKPPAES